MDGSVHPSPIRSHCKNCILDAIVQNSIASCAILYSFYKHIYWPNGGQKDTLLASIGLYNLTDTLSAYVRSFPGVHAKCTLQTQCVLSLRQFLIPSFGAGADAKGMGTYTSPSRWIHFWLWRKALYQKLQPKRAFYIQWTSPLKVQLQMAIRHKEQQSPLIPLCAGHFHLFTTHPRILCHCSNPLSYPKPEGGLPGRAQCQQLCKRCSPTMG